MRLHQPPPTVVKSLLLTGCLGAPCGSCCANPTGCFTDCRHNYCTDTASHCDGVGQRLPCCHRYCAAL